MDSLLEYLQREFCPPLDSSLLAALVSDFEFKGDSGPSQEQINELKSNLKELSIQADAAERSADPSTESSGSGNSFADSSTSVSTTTNDSDIVEYASLAFLQTAFPSLPTPMLQAALTNAELTVEGLDMWQVIVGLLSEEDTRELAERDLDNFDDDDAVLARVIHEESRQWETVTKKTPQIARPVNKKKKGETIVLFDIRQQHHRRARSLDKQNTQDPAPDPWTLITSLSSHLATFFPSHQPSFFQSYFHSPNYKTPYHALVSALDFIGFKTPQTDHGATLQSILDILLSSSEGTKAEDVSSTIADTQLCLRATGGNGEYTLELVNLLRDLRLDSASGEYEMGVYHSQLPAPLPPDPSAAKPPLKLPAGPPPIPPPPDKMKRTSLTPPTGNKPSPYQWQKVPYRKKFHDGPHPLAPYIPAYTRDVNGMKVRGTGNGIGKGGKGDVGELDVYRRRIQESMRKRNDLLREASKMWQKGNAQSRGGEAAMYYAERAREYQELAKKDALDMARTMVQSKRVLSHDQDCIDLHGANSSEAIQIVKECLSSGGYATVGSKPFKVITGRGAHSTNQLSILKPAVRKALLDDGWIVSTWDAGLIVRGKRR